MPPKPSPRAEATAILRRNVGPLTNAAMQRIEADKEWFRGLSAQERSWISMVVQAGIRSFADWYAAHATEASLVEDAESALAGNIFGAAPRAFAGVISLEQTVELSRVTIDTVEANLQGMLGRAWSTEIHNGLLRFGREFAFATAQVYARAAEVRGAWDARLEAMVVDGILRDDPDEAVLSQAGALGWVERDGVVVVLGQAPVGPISHAFEQVRRAARAQHMEALCASRGQRVVVILNGVTDPSRAAAALADQFGPGPVVHGPVVDQLGAAHVSARAAAAALRACTAWPDAPRPVSSDDLLPERALAGDESARQQLVDEVFVPLRDAKGTLIETLDAYFGHGTSVEATGRSLFVHPNTVRYRLKQTAEITGMSPTVPRDAYAIRIAITLGRLTLQ